MNLTEQEELKFERYMNVHEHVMRVPVYVLGITCDFDDIIKCRREGAAYIHHMTGNPFYLRDIQPAFEVCKDIDRLIEKVIRKRALAANQPPVAVIEVVQPGSPVVMPKMDEEYLKQNGYNSLHLGVLNTNDYEYIQWLLDDSKKTFKIDDKTKFGDTAVNLAAQAGKFEVVALLVRNGASLIIENEKKRHAIYYLSKTIRECKPGYLLAADILQNASGIKFRLQMEMFPAAKAEKPVADQQLATSGVKSFHGAH